jgi:hypothetical protein
VSPAWLSSISATVGAGVEVGGVVEVKVGVEVGVGVDASASAVWLAKMVAATCVTWTSGASAEPQAIKPAPAHRQMTMSHSFFFMGKTSCP